MKMFAITLYLVAYLCTLINADDVNPRIYYGNEISNCRKYPWNAQLYYSGHICGGTLISKKFVLTASHCTPECRVGTHYTVYLGSTKRKRGKKYAGKLKGCFSNAIDFGFDVAVVELNKPVRKTRCINYLSIYDVKGPIRNNIAVTAIGFGNSEISKFPKNLIETTSLSTVSIHECEKDMNRVYGSLTHHICTKSNYVMGQNNCYGDSGGGLIYKEHGYEPVLIGIVSFGSDNCYDGNTAYAKVNDPIIINWIKKMTEYY